MSLDAKFIMCGLQIFVFSSFPLEKISRHTTRQNTIKCIRAARIEAMKCQILLTPKVRVRIIKKKTAVKRVVLLSAQYTKNISHTKWQILYSVHSQTQNALQIRVLLYRFNIDAIKYSKVINLLYGRALIAL